MDDGRIYLDGLDVLNKDELFTARPTPADEKKMRGGTISCDHRILWGGRYVNLFPRKCDYFKPEYVQIEDIVVQIIRLSRSYRGVDISTNKPDIKSAYKLARIHPVGVKLFPTDVAGRFSGLSSSAIAFYLVFPFGLSDPP